MNTIVNFEIAKLLKEKGFDKRVKPFYNGLVNNELVESDIIGFNNNLSDWYPAPTIAEVVMWLYEKHGIWIMVKRVEYETLIRWDFYVNNNYPHQNLMGYDSPIEAYSSAIEYTLKNLIK